MQTLDHQRLETATLTRWDSEGRSKMSNGNGDVFVKWALGLLGTLAALGISAMIAIGNDQSALEEKVKQNSQSLADRRAAIQAVPVIVRDLEHIKETMDRSEQRSEEQYRAILNAIKKD